MKRLEGLSALFVLAAVASFPCAAAADRDLAGLDVTMEVLDEEAEFDELAAELRGPERDGIDEKYFDDEERDVDDPRGEREYDFEAGRGERDEFEDDEMNAKDKLRYDDEFENLDGEDVDEEAGFDEPDALEAE